MDCIPWTASTKSETVSCVWKPGNKRMENYQEDHRDLSSDIAETFQLAFFCWVNPTLKSKIIVSTHIWLPFLGAETFEDWCQQWGEKTLKQSGGTSKNCLWEESLQKVGSIHPRTLVCHCPIAEPAKTHTSLNSKMKQLQMVVVEQAHIVLSMILSLLFSSTRNTLLQQRESNTSTSNQILQIFRLWWRATYPYLQILIWM